MKAKLFIIVFVLSVLFLSWAQSEAQCNKRDALFRIERSKNKNIVRYDACLLQNGNISGSNPVDVYWILEKGKKEELNTVEKEHAYGIESMKEQGKNIVQVFIKALKDRAIIVKKLKADYKAFVRIKGELSILEKVYVKSEETMLGFPKVDYVDLFGRSLQTNRPVQERITPS
jgi:hypothetical protein